MNKAIQRKMQLMNNKGFFTAIIATTVIFVIFMASSNYISRIDLSKGELFAQQINETNRLWQNAYFGLGNWIECSEEGNPSINRLLMNDSLASAFGKGSTCSTSPLNPDPNDEFELTCSKEIRIGDEINKITVSKTVSYNYDCGQIMP